MDKEREMLTPNYDHEIPEMTVEVAKATFPKVNGGIKYEMSCDPCLSTMLL
jgi:hypothetical protein